jgi:uncharacterized repeat protein (TIGR01451 family)
MRDSLRRICLAALVAAAAGAIALTGVAGATSSAASADLAVSMTAPAQLSGSAIQYVITVRNLGPDASSGSSVDDTLPFDTTHRAAPSTTSGTCAVTQVQVGVIYEDHVHCDLGALASGASATVTIGDNWGAVGPVTNTATVSGVEPDSVGSNNSASATTIFQPAAVSVGVASPASATAGTPFTTTVTVANAGPASAPRTDVDISWTGAAYVSASAPSGSCSLLNGGLLECYVDGVAAGGAGTIAVTLISAGAGTVPVTASILDVQNAYDTTSDDNTATTSTSVGASTTTPQTDLSIAASGPATLKNGQGATWSLTITNHSSTTTATGVHVSLAIHSLFVDMVGAGCLGGSNTECNLSALQPGASVTISFGGNATAEGTATMTATVSSTSADPDASNNASTVTTAVAPGADLSLAMSAPAQYTGGSIDYQLTVRSLGPAGSAGAAVDADLPAGFQQVTATSASGTCAITPEYGAGGFTYPHVHCGLGALPVGGSATVTVHVGMPAEIGPVTIDGRVSGADGDVNHANDTASATTDFMATDVTTSWSAPATVSGNFTDTLTITNTGPSQVQRVDVDLLVGGTSVLSTSWSTCSTASSPVYCHVDGLGPGESATLTLTLDGSATGYATVRALTSLQGAYDTDKTSNDVTATTKVTGPGADFGVSLSAPSSVRHGDSFTLDATLTAYGPESGNSGIRATLPAGLQYVGGTGCVNDGSGFDCFVDSMAAGTSKTWHVTVLATGDGALTASIRTSLGFVADPNPANDTASVVVDVVPPPPAIACPAGVTAGTDPGLASAVVDAGSATASDGTPPVAVTGTRSDGAALAAPYPLGTTTITWTATDADGRAASCTQSVHVVDREPPHTTTSPSVFGWSNGPVTVGFAASDNVAVAAVHVDGQTFAGSTAHVTVSAEGVTTLTYWAVDSSGNEEAHQTLVVRIDETPPAVTCASADGAWHADNVSIGCTAADGGSGLATAADASFALATSVAAGSETADAATGSRGVCDAAGNCATAGPVGGNRVDRKAPDIAIASPTDGAVYVVGASASASFSCTDGGSGVVSCTGPSALDTATPGTKQLTVTAVDAVGNSVTVTRTYTVAYAVCNVQVDPPVVHGPVLHVSLQLCDATGRNVSSSSIAVTAASLDGVQLSGAGFAVTGGTYRLQLRLPASLAPGTHTLRIAVAGDPTVHTVEIRTA